LKKLPFRNLPKRGREAGRRAAEADQLDKETPSKIEI
jgi:hypothetical protein